MAQGKIILPSNSLKPARIAKYQQFIIADFGIIKSSIKSVSVDIVLQYFSSLLLLKDIYACTYLDCMLIAQKFRK